MSKATTTQAAKRISEASQVLDLMDSEKTQADACRIVGKNIQIFLYLICKTKELY